MEIINKNNRQILTSQSDGLFDKYTSTIALVNQDEKKNIDWAVGYFKKFISKHLPENKSSSIIEVGCGFGRYLKALSIMGYNQVSGIDISQEQIQFARTRLGLSNVEVADALVYFQDKHSQFDVILAFDFLEHLNVNQSIEMLKILKSSLKENGVIILQVPNALAPLSPIRYADLTHHRAYTVNSMQQSLLLAGFTQFHFFALPPFIHGIKSAIRNFLWSFFVSPLISLLLLIESGERLGGIYTPNLLAVVRK